MASRSGNIELLHEALELGKFGGRARLVVTLGHAPPEGEQSGVEAQRLDAALLAIWRRVTKGDDKAIDRMLGIMKRRMELFGLAAPRRQELSGLIATLSARDLNLKGLSAAELAELERLV